MSASSKLACVIAAGGTAGHVRPALAVAEALRARGVTVTFAGTPDRVESRLVPEAGFPLDTFPVSGLPRRPSAAQLRAAWRASRAPGHCLRILARRNPDVVLGAGGYVAGPMVLAARLRRIPAALTEADAHLGLANRLAAPFARRLFLAYEIPGATARRCASSAVRSRSRTVARHARRARRRFGLPPDEPVVAVFGALAGARSLNEVAVAAWARATARRCSTSAASGTIAALRPRVDRPGYVLLRADRPLRRGAGRRRLAVSRAGGTVWELAAAGTPAILVPYPHATADHQTLNARHFERGGARSSCPTPRSTASRPSSTELLASPGRLATMREAMLRLARPDAAERSPTS